MSYQKTSRSFFYTTTRQNTPKNKQTTHRNQSIPEELWPQFDPAKENSTRRTHRETKRRRRSRGRPRLRRPPRSSTRERARRRCRFLSSEDLLAWFPTSISFCKRSLLEVVSWWGIFLMRTKKSEMCGKKNNY